MDVLCFVIFLKIFTTLGNNDMNDDTFYFPSNNEHIYEVHICSLDFEQIHCKFKC